MATALQKKRQVISERRWQGYEDFMRDKAEREVGSERPYIAAAEVINYAQIEQQAMSLIETHEARPKPLMVQEYEDNARTAIFEAITARGHISVIEISGKTLEEIHDQVLQRLLNGYDMDLPEPELKRRFREICEVLANHEIDKMIVAGELPPDTEMVSESTYASSMSDHVAESLGYRSQNRKGMTRSAGLRINPGDTYTRVIEQVSYSNSSAHNSILRLHQEGIDVPRSDEADVDLLGRQLLYSRRDMEEGVVGVQRRIDRFQGGGVRFGEEPDSTTPTYESLREVSKQREDQVEFHVKKLAAYEKHLDKLLNAGEITRAEWSERYGLEVRKIVRTICAYRPEYTRDALGEDVVGDYQAVNQRLLEGDMEGAARIMDDASSREHDILYCGTVVNNTVKSPNSQAPASDTRKRLKEAKENWKWTKGKCRIDLCPTRKKSEEVYIGPCKVCAECQAYYDKGKDPKDVYKQKLKKQMLDSIDEKQTAPEQTGRLTKADRIKQAYGPKARYKEIPKVGYAVTEVYDETGQLLDIH